MAAVPADPVVAAVPAAPAAAAAPVQAAPADTVATPPPRWSEVPVEVAPGEPFRRPSADVLRARRARLLEAIEGGIALIPSAEARDLESAYPQDSDFRQSNDFFYLTGLETPDSWLVLAPDAEGGEPLELLFVPERDPAEEVWTGPRPSLEEAGRIAGIAGVRPAEEAARALGPGGEAGVGPDAILHLPATLSFRDTAVIRTLQGSGAEARALDPTIGALRLVKDDFELEMMRRAIDLTTGAHRAAMRVATPGMYEYELEAVIEFSFRLGGAERVGFPSIVGSGPNSVILHYDKNRRMMEEGDLVVIDVGAEYSYYTADVTRTLPVSGRFTPRQRRIYDLVLGAQQAAIDSVRPGITVARLDRIARAWLRDNSGDACGARTCDGYFVHGLAHWLGMDVHDVGDYGTPLAPGMVLTIEPGIYLPDENLGVRIEDDVLVTADGHQVLSEAAPRRAEEVEALMREGAGAAVPAAP